jgi:uncharacterized SAM-binding protein YcdF (DUF218 family)
MAEVAKQQGVPPEALILETKSCNTYENARMALKIASERQLNRLLVVSDWYHLPRARLAFGPAVTHYVGAETISTKILFQRIPGIIYELLAYPYYLIKLNRLSRWSIFPSKS